MWAFFHSGIVAPSVYIIEGKEIKHSRIVKNGAGFEMIYGNGDTIKIIRISSIVKED